MEDLERETKIGYGDIKIKTKYLKETDLVEVSVEFDDYGTYSYKISSIVLNIEKDIREAINGVMDMICKIRGEDYHLLDNDNFTFEY